MAHAGAHVGEASTPPRHRVALIGDAFVDLNLSGLARLPEWGIDVPCAGVTVTVGGSCANTARQLASLGRASISATFFSCVGDDAMGQYFQRALRDENLLVDQEASLHVETGVPQSVCTILAGPSDRAMISCYTSNERISVSPFRAELLASPWACLHIGGYYNCVGLHEDDFLEVVTTLRAGGTLISLDPQHDANEEWTGKGGHLGSLLPHLDCFMPNEVEICHVARVYAPGADAAGGSSSLPPSPESALEALAAAYPHVLIVLTMGSAGLRAARGESERWTQPASRATFVDATGAGDACAAAVLSQLVRDRTDVQTALRAGAAAGALCVGAAGACEAPITPEQLDGMLACG